MGYTLNIEREAEIPVAEWKIAVQKIDGIRIDEYPLRMKNKTTEQIIEIEGSKTDVAVRFVEKKLMGLKRKETWVKSIAFSNGKGIIKYTESLEDENNPVRKAVSSLSKVLGATITGEEGELYNW